MCSICGERDAALLSRWMRPTDDERVIWHRVGDHRVGGARIVEQCPKTKGGLPVGRPDVKLILNGTSTAIEVDPDPWWTEYMAVRRDWDGPVKKSDLLDVLAPLKPLGDQRNS